MGRPGQQACVRLFSRGSVGMAGVAFRAGKVMPLARPDVPVTAAAAMEPCLNGRRRRRFFFRFLGVPAPGKEQDQAEQKDEIPFHNLDTVP